MVRKSPLVNEAALSTQDAGIAHELNEKYGYFMTLDEVAHVLRLKSGNALRMACRRGQIDLQPVRAKERPLKFATRQVASVVERRLDCRACSELQRIDQASMPPSTGPTPDVQSADSKRSKSGR
jgi:hypothetical protein